MKPTGERAWIWWAAVALLLIGTLAYARTLAVPLLLDDLDALGRNATIRHLWPPRWALPPAGTTVSGRPVLNFSFALSYALGGGSLAGHHVLNLAIHLGAGLLLLGVVRRTLQLRAFSPALRAGAGPIAFGTALLWTVHPLQTEAVTYLAQRAESLMGLFFLLTFYAYLRALTSAHSARWNAIAITACALGAGTKEVAAVAPLLVFLHDRAFVAGRFALAWARRRALYLGLAGTWVISAVLLASTGGNRDGSAGFDVGVRWSGYWFTQFEAVARYLRLSAWPHSLVFEYGTFFARAGEAAPFMPIVIALVVLVSWGMVRRSAAGLCGAWFFLILAPTSLVPGTVQMIVEHRMYLSLAAVIVVSMAALWRAVGRRASAVCAALGVAAATLTFARNQDYVSDVRLWRDTIEKRPANARAYNALGLALLRQRQLAAAVENHARAVALAPANAEFHNDLGNTLFEAGQSAQAVAEVMRALELKPTLAIAHANLAFMLTQLGRPDEAIRQGEIATELAPHDARARHNFGRALLAAGRVDDALGQLRLAVEADPDAANARTSLGLALIQAGRPDAALEHLAAAARLAPRDPAAQHNLQQLQSLLARRANGARPR